VGRKQKAEGKISHEWKQMSITKNWANIGTRFERDSSWWMAAWCGWSMK